MVHGASRRASARREQLGQRTLRTIGVLWRKPGPVGTPLGCWAAPKKGLPQHWKSASMMTWERRVSRRLEQDAVGGRKGTEKEEVREGRRRGIA
jgi:hypothetical protein